MPVLKPFHITLLFIVLVLTGSFARAQDSEIITVTGLYASYPPGGEYQEILTPCDRVAVWDVVPKGPAFAALAQVYTSLETSGQFLRNEDLFVEVRGRYFAYTGESHSDGLFEVTEFVRHSTAAADITACNTNSPDSPDLEDGQCGSTRNSCLAGHSFDHDMANLADTATEYRWECLGLSGGDSVVCTAPKAHSPLGLRGAVDGVSRLHSGPLTLYGWAYNTAASTTNIPVEIYVGGARGTGTLAATVTADQPRPDVNTTYSITGAHGFAWAVPAHYQTSAQDFYVYALDQSPTPTVRTQLSPGSAPLRLRAVGTADYCQHHGPCIVDQGDCASNAECQSGLKCVANAGTTIGVCEDGGTLGFCTATSPCPAGLGDCNYARDCARGLWCAQDVGTNYGHPYYIDICEAPANGAEDHCLTTQPCSAGEGDCDSDAECASGTTCAQDVGATYGFRADVDVCEASTSGNPVPPTQVQSIYRLATRAPATPSGGTSTENHVPSGWSTTQPSATTTQGVYRSQRTVTYQGGVFQSATAWDTPTRVTAPTAPTASLRGHVDVISRLNSGPLTLYGWAYNTAASTANIPVEIYVDGARGTGTLAATITADQPRPDVNTAHSITGDHGFAWPVPAQYQSGTHTFHVYALDRNPNPTVRTHLQPPALTLLAPGHYDYCKNHGPCIAGHGDCDPATPSECQNGLTCATDVGANYGWGTIIDVCEATTSGNPVVTTQGQSIYRLATRAPAAPSGGTSTENHVPAGWSTSQPSATTTQGVYRSQRTATYHDQVFHAATAWGTPTRITAPTTPTTSLRGAADVVSRLHGPLTLYGWAYNTAASTANIPVEIYVGGARGTGTLAATLTADQPRADVNTVHGITGDHGFAWAVPAHYQSRAHTFHVYALDRNPNPTMRQHLSNSPLSLLAPGHADYCKNHGPCAARQGDCDSNDECQSGTVCTDDVGATYGFAADVDVCVQQGGTWSYCTTASPCAAGLGDCDSDAECASGTTCVHNVGANYGYPVSMDVCEAAPPVVTTQGQSIYRLGTSAPATPSGGTSTENHVPSGWSTTQPSATTTQGVYRSQRTVTYHDQVFHAATAWGTPTRITAPTTVSLRGYVDVISRLHSRPLTLYGWAYNTAASTANIPVEIYVDGARGTGTLAATITADQPRADVNTVHGITGDHGFEWAVPAQYQSGTHTFHVYALDRNPNPTVRTHLQPPALTLLAPGHHDYCKNHGPCIAGHGDCDPATPSECQSGLTCATDVGANYGWSTITDVCEAPPPVVTTQTQSIYRRGTSAPATPSGGTSTENHVPSGWSTSQPSATTTQGVYRSQRTVTYRGRTFQSATAWGTPTRVTAPTSLPVGHANYCRDQGPCSAGQGDCDRNSECQSGLTCVQDVGANYGWARTIDVCEVPETAVRTLTAASQALRAPNPHAGDMLVNFASRAASTRRFTLQGRTYQLNNVVIYDTNGRLEIASLMNRVGSNPTDYSLPAAVRQKLHIRAKFYSQTLRRNMVIEAAYTNLRLFAAGYYSLYATGDTASFLSQWRIGPDTDNVTIELFTK